MVAGTLEVERSLAARGNKEEWGGVEPWAPLPSPLSPEEFAKLGREHDLILK